MNSGFMISKLVSRVGWKSSAGCGELPGGTVSSPRCASTRWLFLGWFLLLGVALTGPLQAAQDESKVLREQATKFWEARVKGDWATVYDYLSEEDRAGRNKEDYVQFWKQSGPFRYLHYKMGAVEAADEMGWVKIEYTREPVLFPGIKPKLVDRWEQWEKEDGRWTSVSGKRITELPKLPPSLRPLNEEKAVAARAEEFWKAREKSDYAAIYRLCTPTFRNKVSLEEWLSKKAENIYVSHEILWTEVTGDEAVVRTAYEYRLNDPSVIKMDPLPETAMQGWIKIDGQWYLNVKDE